MVKNMKKLVICILSLYASHSIYAITSTQSHRVMATSPLLYKMIDYSKEQTSYEIEPIYSSMYDGTNTAANLIISGSETITLSQQGNGDINPAWLNLMSNNSLANYSSTVTFNPALSLGGVLLHWYEQYEKTFIEIKTALLQCKSQISITELGGGNGLIPGILNAQQAFTQDDWNYGKIGQENHVVGLDNIEIRFGGVTQSENDSPNHDFFITGFGIIEAPTGTGTKSEWLFEPQIGTNHWGIGLGFEALLSSDDDLKFMVAGNYRYLIPNWETRSFDLLGNGQWSRYLSLQDIYGLPDAPATLGTPGINFLTQQAYIKGRSQVNLYARLQKHFNNSYLEASYNFFCLEQERIGDISEIAANYGIYAMTGSSTGGGGVTTSSNATINQDVTSLDPVPVPVTTNLFNKLSASAGTYATNMVTVRFEIVNNDIVYGFGGSIESGLSDSSLSTWSVWAKFELLFDHPTTTDNDYEFSSDLYDYEDEQENTPTEQDSFEENMMAIEQAEQQMMNQAKMQDANSEQKAPSEYIVIDQPSNNKDDVTAPENQMIDNAKQSDNTVDESVSISKDEAVKQIATPDITIAEVETPSTTTITLENAPVITQAEDGLLLADGDSPTENDMNSSKMELLTDEEVLKLLQDQ